MKGRIDSRYIQCGQTNGLKQKPIDLSVNRLIHN